MNKTEKLDEVFTLIEDGIRSITTTAQWKKFLQFQSSFYKYSFNNAILLWLQCPHATYVAGYDAWKKHERFVKKGEKGLKIIAPRKVKVNTEEDGIPNENVKYKVVGYRTVSVFDVSQTDGKPIPSNSFVEKLKGSTDLYKTLLKKSPFPVNEADYCDGSNGYFSLTDKSITILSTNSEIQKLKTLIHEIAHGLLHLDDKTDKNRFVMELEAESVAFIVCNKLGIDSSDYSFGYLAGWGNGEDGIEIIKSSGLLIQKASEEILDLITSEVYAAAA